MRAYRLALGTEAHEFVAPDNDVATKYAVEVLQDVPAERSANLFETFGEAAPLWVVTLGGGRQ